MAVAMNAQTSDMLSRMATELKRLYGTKFRALRVFGSCARNEERPDSDIDVALVLEDFVSPWDEIKRSGEVVARFCLENDVVISVIPVREHDWAEAKTCFMRTLHREGVRLR